MEPSAEAKRIVDFIFDHAEKNKGLVRGELKEYIDDRLKRLGSNPSYMYGALLPEIQMMASELREFFSREIPR
jgi:hypothetical protein